MICKIKTACFDVKRYKNEVKIMCFDIEKRDFEVNMIKNEQKEKKNDVGEGVLMWIFLR